MSDYIPPIVRPEIVHQAILQQPIRVIFIARGHTHDEVDDSISNRYKKIFIASSFITELCNTLGREVIKILFF